MLPKYVQGLVLGAIGGLPLMLETILATAYVADYDKRPDIERFTIREVLAHLADWDAVWTDRVNLILIEDNPSFSRLDPSQMAIDRDYAHFDYLESLRRIADNRIKLVALFEGLSDEQWDRTGTLVMGPVSVEQLATMAIVHDNYHMRQIAEWLKP